MTSSASQRWWNTEATRCRAAAGLLILSAAVLHLAYLACNCPLDLAPDEAHYWDWSRHHDWSYYSKGPLVAHLIRGSTALAGPLSTRLIGSEMLAVRLPAVLCGVLLLAGLYILTVQVFGRDRLALAVVAIALTLPTVTAGSLLMTIDAPYTCCWCWALVLGHAACFRRSPWLWPATGLVVGLGILAKYTMVLWLPSLGLFLLADRDRRRMLMQPGFWIMTGVAFLCSFPILYWNATHDWVTFRHVGGHAGLRSETAGLHWSGPFVFVGIQFALLLGFWFVAWAMAMLSRHPWHESNAGQRYLWWMSAPMFVVFLLFSLKNGGGEPNWPITAYISGLVLTTAWLVEQCGSLHPWRRRRAIWTFAGGCGLGLCITLLMHCMPLLQPVLLRISGAPTQHQPFVLRRFDPTCRLRGWRSLASEVDRVRAELHEEGTDPVLAAAVWALPGEVAFYCEGHPTVHSLGLVLGDRWSQYDLWRPNPVWDPDQFLGKTIVLIGLITPEIKEGFDRVEPTRLVTYEEQGHPIARWGITVCRGFRGLKVDSSISTSSKF